MRIVHLGFAILFSLCSYLASAQPGIYNEDDMSLQGLFMDAQTAKYLDKPEEQIEILKKLIEKDRTCDPCQFEMSLAYLKLDDLEKAQSHIEKALKVDSNNFGYNQTAKKIYDKLDNYDKKIAVLNKMTQLSPNNIGFQEELVTTAIESGDPNLALSNIAKLEQKFGVYEKTTLWKLAIYKKKNDNKGQIDAVVALVNKFPENTRFLNNLASLYSEFGDEKMAQATWNKVIEIEPDNPDANFAIMSSDIDQADNVNYLRTIVPLIENKSIPLDEKIKELIPYISDMSNDPNEPDNVQLLKLADKMVRMYPNEAKTYALRGDIFYYIRDFTSANQDYKKTTDLNKGILSVWEQRMMNEVQMEDFQSLQITSSEAIDFFPLQFKPYFFNAMALIKNNQIPAAESQILEAQFIAAADKEANNKLKYLAALQAFESDDLKAAFNHIAIFETENVNDFLIYELLGDIHAKQGDIKKALKSWNISKTIGNASMTLSKKISEERYIN